MSKFRCVWRNSSTEPTSMKGEMPSACKLKGCAGTFEKKPGCRTFMQDALPPEPIMTSFEWGKITLLEERFKKRAHFGILTACKMYPTRAVARV